jgi:hypothetical protein
MVGFWIFDSRFSIFDWALPRRRAGGGAAVAVVLVAAGMRAVAMWWRRGGGVVLMDWKIENQESKIKNPLRLPVR